MKHCFRKMAVAFLSSFLLCSYSVSPFSFEDGFPDDPDTIEQGYFDSQMDNLSPLLDREEAGADNHPEEDNSLSDWDIELLSDYVRFDETHIELEKTAYYEFPSNDEGLLPEEYYDETGFYYQDDNEEYVQNYKKLLFVEDNRLLRNNIVQDGEGYIDEEGELQIDCDEIEVQSMSDFFDTKVFNFHLSWFKRDFIANYRLTWLLGVFGILVNYNYASHFDELMNLSSDNIIECLNDLSSDLLNLGQEYFGNQITGMVVEIVNIFSLAEDILSTASLVGVVWKVIIFVLGHYLPGLIKGVSMLIGSQKYFYGSYNTLGLWWSSYELSKVSIF